MIAAADFRYAPGETAPTQAPARTPFSWPAMVREPAGPIAIGNGRSSL